MRRLFLLKYKIVLHGKRYWKEKHGITRESWPMKEIEKDGKKTQEVDNESINYALHPLKKIYVEKYIVPGFKLLSKVSDKQIFNFEAPKLLILGFL